MLVLLCVELGIVTTMNSIEEGKNANLLEIKKILIKKI